MAKRTRLESMIPELFHHILNESKIHQIVNFESKKVAYEEIPLIDRYDDIEFLSNYIDKDKYSLFLLNIATFFLHAIQLENLSNNENKYIGLTLCDPYEEIQDVGFVIPNISVCNKTVKKLIDNLPIYSLTDIKLFKTNIW